MVRNSCNRSRPLSLASAWVSPEHLVQTRLHPGVHHAQHRIAEVALVLKIAVQAVAANPDGYRDILHLGVEEPFSMNMASAATRIFCRVSSVWYTILCDMRYVTRVILLAQKYSILGWLSAWLGRRGGCGLNNRRKLCCKHSQESGPAGSTWPHSARNGITFSRWLRNCTATAAHPATGMVAIRPEDILTAYRVDIPLIVSTGPADMSKFLSIDPKILFAALGMPFISVQTWT